MSNYSIKKTEKQGILHDYSRESGKERPWRDKKIQNLDYADLLALLNYKKVDRVSVCADILKFGVTATGHLKLKQSWFCKSRLCPMCAWRRSIKHGVNTMQVVNEAQKRYPKGRWLFLTLTTRNTDNAKDLRDEITKYSKALNSMLKRKAIKDSVHGYARGIEVTVNKEDGSYNQHMHVLLFVKASYFKGGKYLDQSSWVELWKKAMKLDYNPSVRVSAVKKGEENKSVLEVAKYSVKSFDYLTTGTEGKDLANRMKVLDELEKALERKRLTAFGGLLKDIQRELKLEDAEDEEADLVAVGEDAEEETDETVTACWDNFKRNYYIARN